ncbi:MAG: peptidoglycan-binding protein [Bacillota bacterium]
MPLLRTSMAASRRVMPEPKPIRERTPEPRQAVERRATPKPVQESRPEPRQVLERRPTPMPERRQELTPKVAPKAVEPKPVHKATAGPIKSIPMKKAVSETAQKQVNTLSAGSQISKTADSLSKVNAEEQINNINAPAIYTKVGTKIQAPLTSAVNIVVDRITSADHKQNILKNNPGAYNGSIKHSDVKHSNVPVNTKTPNNGDNKTGFNIDNKDTLYSKSSPEISNLVFKGSDIKKTNAVGSPTDSKETIKLYNQVSDLSVSSKSTKTFGTNSSNNNSRLPKFQESKLGKIADSVVNPEGSSSSDETIDLNNNALLVKGSSGDEVKKLQEALKQLNYDVGEIDGKFGAKTKASVEAFQKDQQLSQDGKAGSKTITALEVALKTNATAKENIENHYYKVQEKFVKDMISSDVSCKSEETVANEKNESHLSGVENPFDQVGTNIQFLASALENLAGIGEVLAPRALMNQKRPNNIAIGTHNKNVKADIELATSNLSLIQKGAI